MLEQVTVVLVDDHDVVRRGLRSFLETEPGLQVVGEAGNGAGAVALVQELVPDVVLMDLVMPGMDGIEATRRVRQVSPQTRVVVLTSYGDDAKVFPAIQAGALSYLLKTARADEVAAAVRAAGRGEAVIDPGVATRLMQALQQPALANPGSDLTERERDVLRLIAKGYTNQQIAAELYIGIKTVKSHVSNVLSKLHLEDRTQAAIFALKKGLDA